MKRMLSLLLAAALLISLTACGSRKEEPAQTLPPITTAAPENEAPVTEETVPPTTEETVSPTTEETAPPTTEETAPPTTEETVPPTTEARNLVNGMRPEFKEAMDTYEEFIDEYVAFMKKYAEKEGDVSMLLEYGKFLGKYAEFVADFEAWEDQDLNTAELNYYIQVQSRVAQKLLAAAMPG